MKKINVYINGIYEYSTERFTRCRDAVAAAKSAKRITVASVPKNRFVTICDNDKVTAHFAK